MVRSLIEEDVDVGSSATLGRYESESKGEETSSRSPTHVKKPEMKEKRSRGKIGKVERRTLG